MCCVWCESDFTADGFTTAWQQNCKTLHYTSCGIGSKWKLTLLVCREKGDDSSRTCLIHPPKRQKKQTWEWKPMLCIHNNNLDQLFWAYATTLSKRSVFTLYLLYYACQAKRWQCYFVKKQYMPANPVSWDAINMRVNSTKCKNICQIPILYTIRQSLPFTKNLSLSFHVLVSHWFFIFLPLLLGFGVRTTFRYIKLHPNQGCAKISIRLTILIFFHNSLTIFHSLVLI